MRDENKLNQIVQLLGEKMTHLTQKDMDELKEILPEADKNLFL
jgi:hypothetical protein